MSLATGAAAARSDEPPVVLRRTVLSRQFNPLDGSVDQGEQFGPPIRFRRHQTESALAKARAAERRSGCYAARWRWASCTTAAICSAISSTVEVAVCSATLSASDGLLAMISSFEMLCQSGRMT